MKKLPALILILTLLFSCTLNQREISQQDPGAETSLEKFSDMKFGMFIHWGLYALPAGEWKGKQLRGIGEWIMYRYKIPVTEYEKLADQFNPVKFNADEWTSLAKDAGMKYMVITSKHHDGFAMFHSGVTNYNIYDATAFKRDPLAELSKSAAGKDIRFGFYYSQAQDWHERNGAGNTWDFPVDRDPSPYLKDKVFPQVEELLTGYGNLALIWFDTPQLLTEEQVIQLRSLVKSKQPECLVNNRIGYKQGDYEQMGDNAIPTLVFDWQTWEVPATLNDTWGFKKNDHNWKDPKDLIYKLTDIVSKGGNYLLNVGPTAEGMIPAESQDILREIGKWLQINGEAIYNTKHSPLLFPGASWKCTVKPGKMYIHIFDDPGEELRIDGLVTKVKKAWFLDGHNNIKFSKDGNSLVLQMPAEIAIKYSSVIVLELKDEVPVIADGYRYNDPQQQYSLFAKDARKGGEELRYLDDVKAATGFMGSESPLNELMWYHYPYETANYKVSIEYSCDDSVAGSPFVLQKQKNRQDTDRINGTIQPTGGEFQKFAIGEMSLEKQELNLLRFKLEKDFTSSSLKFRRLILDRI